jgi:hypothetical protein
MKNIEVMDEKIVHIIGGGLYGGLTAYMFAKYRPEYTVRLFENSNHLLSAFDSIQIGDESLNNGFHGVELPRAIDLFNFFNEELGVEFYKQFNHRGISINGKILSFLDKLEDWPIDLQKFIGFDTSKNKFEFNEITNLISSEYQNLIKNVSKRYTDNIEDVKGLFIPWFLPADVAIEASDEGDIFRNQVRSKEIISEYGFPKLELFNVIQSKLYEFLKGMNVDIILNSKIHFTDKGIEYNHTKYSNESPEKIFFCASPALLIRDLFPSVYSEMLANKCFLYNALLKIDSKEFYLNKTYTEIISLDEKIPQIGRISFPKLNCKVNETYVQVEIFTRETDNITKLSECLPFELSRIFSLKEYDTIKLIDIVRTRTLFFPTQTQKESAFNKLIGRLEEFESKIFVRNIFGPINMTKTWIFSKENINL